MLSDNCWSFVELPHSFEETTRNLFGEEEYTQYLQALADEAPVTIRLNEEKQHADLQTIKVPWATAAYYLDERPTFTFDPLFHAGCYYVQEASSMFVEQALRYTKI